MTTCTMDDNGLPDVHVTMRANKVKVINGEKRAFSQLEECGWFKALLPSGEIIIVARSSRDGTLQEITRIELMARLHRKWNSSHIVKGSEELPTALLSREEDVRGRVAA